jgi:hypothetical protein
MAGANMPINRRKKRNREIRMSTARFFRSCQPRLPHSVFIFQGGGKAGRPILQLRLAQPKTPK